MDERESGKDQESPIPGRTEYEQLADRVGLVPNLRVADNLLQALVVLFTMAVGAASGAVVGGIPLALAGGLVGMVLGGFVSGFALMVLGWLR